MDFFMHCVPYVSFSSGGTQGYLHIGAVTALSRAMGQTAYEQWRASIRGVAGCSAGCFMALAMVLNVSMDEMHNSFPFKNLIARLTDQIQNLVETLGMSTVDVINDITASILSAGGLTSSITLEHLHRFTRTECVFVCTSLTTRQRVYLSHTSHPTVSVTDAISASCCIPGVFRPVLINGEYMVDGALVEFVPRPFPVDKTFHFIIGIEHRVTKVLDLSSYATSLMAILSRYEAAILEIPRHRRVVLMDQSPPFDPFISEAQALRIRHSGFIQMMGLLHMGVETHLVSIIRRCIDMNVRLSIGTDITTNGGEGLPPTSGS